VSFFARLATGVAAVVVAAIVAGALFWYAVAADRSHPQASEQLVVQTGTTFDEIASQLVAGGVIGNTLTFRILARFAR